MRRLLLPIFLIGALLASAARADDAITRPGARKAFRVVEGTVYDSTGGAPIPYVTVQLEGTRRSTLTNDDGRYRILLEDGPNKVRFSHIAYYSKTQAFTADDTSCTLDVRLMTSVVDIGTFRVYTRAYDDGQRIIVEAIRRKEEILNRFHDFRYQAYTKVVFDDLTKSKSSPDRIFLIAESQTTAFWEHPDKYKEIITARRQTANIPPEANLVGVGEISNFNANRIDFGAYSIVSPTAEDALDHYNYYLLDTLYYDSMRVFKLEIEPKNPRDPLFVGTVCIADSTYDVVAVDVGLSDGFEIALLEDPNYVQRSAHFDNGYWLPVEIRFSVDIEFDIPLPFVPRRMHALQVATLHDYQIDVGHPKGTFNEYMIEVDEKADDFDSTAWFGRQALALTGDEQAAYGYIESAEHAPKSVGEIAKSVAMVALYVGMGGAQDFFRFNRVEGAYLGVGLNPYVSMTNTELRLKGGYAFAAKQGEWQVGFTQHLCESRRLNIGFDYMRRIRARPTIFAYGDADATFFALWDQYDPFDYHRVRGYEVFAETKLVNYTRLKVKYSDLEYRSIPANSDFGVADGEEPRLNPPVSDGDLRSLATTFTWDSRRLFRVKSTDMRIDRPPYTVFTAEMEYASPDFVDNDFDYRRYYMSLLHKRPMFGLGITTFRLMAGSADGDLPPQRYHIVNFGNFLVYDANIVKTLDERNFGGDRVASANLLHRFGNRLWVASGIPVIEDIPFWLNVHGAVFWTDFRNLHRDEIEPNLLVARTPYAEAGFGIGNLTPFLAPFNLEVNFTWQISKFDTNRWLVDIGIEL